MSVRVQGPLQRSGTALRISRSLFQETFAKLRDCGVGARECQVLWVGPWSEQDLVGEVVHPRHMGHFGGFKLDDPWLTQFWLELANRSWGIRAQVHTHPGTAFHSQTDDDYPIVRTTGFLSLVIPRFAQGNVTLAGTYLCEVQDDGSWLEVDARDRLSIID
jgi:hypothetical protein